MAKMEIFVTGISEDVDVYVSYGCPAHREAYDYCSIQSGQADESILITGPQPGTWHVSVFGNHDVRNGSSYELEANWE
jgi:hypothetical protein